jgi:hypothetical protein
MSNSYQVESILDCRSFVPDSNPLSSTAATARASALRAAAGIVDGLEFKVKWKGFAECTWIRAHNFAGGAASPMLIAFMQLRAARKAIPEPAEFAKIDNDHEDESPLVDHLPLTQLLSSSRDRDDEMSLLDDHVPLSQLVPKSNVGLMGPPAAMISRVARQQTFPACSSVSAGGISSRRVPVLTPTSPAEDVQVNFLQHTFFIDYYRPHDQLSSVLSKLHARIVHVYPSDPNDRTCILVYEDGSAPHSTHMLVRSTNNRYAPQVATSSTPSMPDHRIVAQQRHLSMSRSKLLRLAEAELNQVKVPRIVVTDMLGMYAPEVSLFPMVPVFKPQAAAAAGGQPQFKRELAHTIPQLDWNAPSGKSPFTKGGLPYTAAAAAAVKVEAKRSMWCEWCRVTIDNEQTVGMPHMMRYSRTFDETHELEGRSFTIIGSFCRSVCCFALCFISSSISTHLLINITSTIHND